MLKEVPRKDLHQLLGQLKNCGEAFLAVFPWSKAGRLRDTFQALEAEQDSLPAAKDTSSSLEVELSRSCSTKGLGQRSAAVQETGQGLQAINLAIILTSAVV